MFQNLRACLWLLIVTIVLCCVAYPLVLWGIGKVAFRGQATGSIVQHDGKDVGSLLIAQPFSDDKYFQPRPSAASYDASASAAYNWSANNYQLRDRVARQLGTLVKFARGPKKDQPAGPEVESWFQKDQFAGKAGIVSQWANLHSQVVQTWLHDWVKADKLNAAYVADWEAKNADNVAKWKSENNSPDPKPEDLAKGLAVDFFASFSQDHPGRFPGVAEYDKDGKTAKRIGPVKEGSDIQSLFFDMWLTDHADQAADLEKVPADLVTASGSGLDPHIMLDSARWQLDHLPIAAAWAKSSGKPGAEVRDQILKILDAKRFSPLNGLVGVPLVNVLEVNLALEEHFQKPGK